MFEITEVNPEDMELILKCIYGALDAIPDQRVQSLYLATERLEVGCLPDLPALPWLCQSNMLLFTSPQRSACMT